MTTAAAVESPYKGLRPFEDSDVDALLFFGRERETDVIAANLLAARLTVLYGPSGVGKSSVLRAGVMTRLRADGDVVVRFESWSGDPVAGIAEAVRAAVSAEVDAEVEEEVDDPGGPLAERLRAWSERLGVEIYLVLDQVEEYFLYHGRNGRPDALLSELPDVVNAPALRVHVLLGIREDALALLDAFKARIPHVLGNYLRLDRLDRAAGEAAILGPLAAWHELTGDEVAAEPELVAALLDEVAVDGDRIEAPYLQVVLERIWEAERASGSSLLRRSTLAGLGGAERIVDEHLERALTGLGGAERDTAAAMFAHLVTPSGTKIAHELHDLASYAGTDVREVASALVRERILRPVDGGSNGGRVEIYHDVLAAAVADWRRRHETERQLARERRRQRRLAATVGVLVLGLALMTALAAYAFSQRSEAREQAELAASQRAAALSAADEARSAEDRAQSALAEARRQQGIAQDEAQNARRAESRAQESASRERDARSAAEASERAAVDQAAAAEAAQSEAEAAQSEAEAAQAEAEGARADAEGARDAAEASAREAREQQRRAVAARRTAQREELRAKVGELTAQSRAQLPIDPAESLRLAVEAAKLAPRSALVEDAVFAALRDLRVLAVLDAGGGVVRDAAFSTDGRLALTAADRGEARVFDVRTGALRRRLRHADVVGAAVFSRDSRFVATGSRDNRARLWSVETGTLVRTLAHAGPVIDLVFTPDGRYVLTASTDKNLRIWDTASGLLLQEIAHRDSLRDLVLSPDGRHVVTLTGDRFARVFRVSGGALVAQPAMAGEITSAAFSPRGDLLATTGRRNIGVWETAGWSQRWLLLGHEGITVVRAAAFSPDGARLAAAAGDGSARTWDLASGEALHMHTGHHHGLTSIAYLANGTFATASLDRTVRVWTGPLGQAPFALFGHREAVRELEVAPDGARILTGSDDGTARLWSTPSEPRLTEIGRHGAAVTATTFNPGGTHVLSTSLDDTARLTPTRGGSARTLAHGAPVVSGALTRDGRTVLTASANGIARTWRSADAAALRTFDHGATVGAAALDPRGAWVATAGADGTTKVWNAGTASVRWARASGDPLLSVAVSRDGSLLAVGAENGSARVYRTADGRVVRTLEAHDGPVAALAFSPDGARLVTAGDDHVGRVWALAGGSSRSLEGHTDGLTAALFSPDGKVVLTTSVDGFGRLWDPGTGRLLRTLSGHVAVIAGAAFSPDGRWIVTAGPGAAGIWNTRTGERLPFLRGHAGPLRAAAFSADGRRVVTGGADGTVRTYRCTLCAPVAELIRQARARLRTLDRASAAARPR